MAATITMELGIQTMDYRLTLRFTLFLGVLLAPAVQADDATIILDEKDPTAVYRLEGATLLKEREGVKIAERPYRYFALKLADNIRYEGYITRCADDYAANLSEGEQQRLSRCTEQVSGDIDRLMEKTANLTFYYSGTHTVYRGDEDSTSYYYFSSARVANFYQSEDGRHPMYGLVYRCSQPARDVSQAEEPGASETAQPSAEAERFIALAKKRCANL